MSGTDWRSYLVSCSNQARWGEDDERGTLNYITPGVTLAALGLATTGDVVSIAHDIPRFQPEASAAAHLKVWRNGPWLEDTVSISPHGFELTHLDAVVHASVDDRRYNGRSTADVFDGRAVSFGSIMAMSSGIVTRGVFLDVAAARGVDSLEEGEGVSLEDIRNAEMQSGLSVREGDAILLRSGIGQRDHWSTPAGAVNRPGILAEVIPWLYEKRVAVYGGDCAELLPPDGAEGDFPLHQVGLPAMGLALLDNPDVEVLRLACQRHGRQEFLLLIAPLRIRGATGSAVNPLAVF
jgi:kynurenine formamidase